MPETRTPPKRSSKPAEPAAKNGTTAKIPKHRRCPSCFGVRGGVGQQNGTYRKSSSRRRRYYRCDQCNHTWAIDLRYHVIEEA